MSEPIELPRTDSLTAELAALQRLGTSRRVRPLFIWLAGVIGAAGSGGIGWIASKVDTMHDMAAIRTDLAAIRSSQEAQARSLHDLLGTDPPGRVVQLERGQRYAFRAAIEARTAALSGEQAKVRAAKEAEAERLGASYERRTDRLAPAAAYDDVLSNVAIH